MFYLKGSDMGKWLLLLLPGAFSQFLFENIPPGIQVSGVVEEMPVPGAGDHIFGCPEEVKCNKSASYREFDGRCNNLKNSLWGSAGVMYQRFLPARYDDDLTLCGSNNCAPYPCSKLPTARQIVSALNNLPTSNCSKITVLAMVWGQFISHDINLTPTVSDLQCCVNCSNNPIEDNNCLPIDVKNDTFYKQFDIECLENTRSAPASPLCSVEREQVNSITAYIDCSLVYAISKDAATNLRTHTKGQMKVDGDENLQGESCSAAPVCPFKLLPSVPKDEKQRILAGDVRAPQHPSLTAVHAFIIRVHNDIAKRLSKIHRDYEDEQLYQEARQIVIALVQHITYNEFLPSILPSWALEEYGLPSFSPGQGYFTGYDENIDATLHNSFSAAAYRFGHSLVPDLFNLMNGNNFELSRVFFKHEYTYNYGTYPSDILNGISFQKSKEVDQNLVSSVSGKLFADPPNFNNGSDLYSRNILRGRDHGLPSYIKWREFCGLPQIMNFEDLNAVMKKGVAKEFKEVYKNIQNIELYPAAISEKADEDGIVGPTLTCLLSKQFRNLKYGDRFQYESISHPNQFNEDQLDSIRRTKLSDLLCRYTNTKKVPKNAMKILGKGNKMKKCKKVSKKTVLTDLEILF